MAPRRPMMSHKRPAMDISERPKPGRIH
jgi:hypothetical protein